MSTLGIRVLKGGTCAAIVIGSFLLGRISGTLQESLAEEQSYPWALHRKIAKLAISCESFRPTRDSDRFIVQPADDGKTLLIAVLNTELKSVAAFAVSDSGKLASDSWSLECK